MSPNIRRFLPMLVIFAALLFIVPALTKKHGSSAAGKSTAAATNEAMGLVGAAEKRYLAGHGHYSSHLTDLVASSPGLAADLAAGVTVTLDVASDGKTFLAQVSSDQLSLVRSRNAAKILAQGCKALASGVKCPVAAKGD
jgi:hypothetical protein